MVKVYRFEKYDVISDKMVPAECKMTVGRIRANGGFIIEGTEEDVPEAALDDEERYYSDA